MASRAVWSDETRDFTPLGTELCRSLGLTGKDFYEKFLCKFGGHTYIRYDAFRRSSRLSIAFYRLNKVNGEMKKLLEPMATLVNADFSRNLEIVFTISQPTQEKKSVSVRYGAYTDRSFDYIGMRVVDIYDHLRLTWNIPDSARAFVNDTPVKAIHKLNPGDSLTFHNSPKRKR